MAIQQLSYLTPPVAYGIYLAAFQDAIDLLNYCRTQSAYACRVSDKLDGTFEVQVEAVNIATAVATQNQWLVIDGPRFYVLSQAEFNAKYKVP
jgi:hypothetical protein